MEEAVKEIEWCFIELLSLEEGAPPTFDWLINSSLPAINFYRSLMDTDVFTHLRNEEFDFVSLDVMNSCEILVTLKWRSKNG
ncbi:hypothetical protein 2050HW_00305 [Serratia phage vB_SmaM_ 2050HW]|nr:hypothetical protein HWB23_gp305 [Serratia phage vB_SmaM_ 2050HW]ATA65640.1 hypothetical protein 2050HW_00305 [Serratia phage vB_SmaM_ 2050HW]UGO54253.1 hypothetical protein HAYMO_271 [Serratia phage vB_SmaM_Haymo]